jgi:hypothetical protein
VSLLRKTICRALASANNDLAEVNAKLVDASRTEDPAALYTRKLELEEQIQQLERVRDRDGIDCDGFGELNPPIEQDP